MADLTLSLWVFCVFVHPRASGVSPPSPALTLLPFSSLREAHAYPYDGLNRVDVGSSFIANLCPQICGSQPVPGVIPGWPWTPVSPHRTLTDSVSVSTPYLLTFQVAPLSGVVREGLHSPKVVCYFVSLPYQLSAKPGVLSTRLHLTGPFRGMLLTEESVPTLLSPKGHPFQHG